MQKICLCGSTKNQASFEQAEKYFTLKGFIVYTVGMFGHCDPIKLSESKKEMLDRMHKEKIDLSDFIVVVDDNNYVGSSTKSEISYAAKQGKEIQWWSTYQDSVEAFFEDAAVKGEYL